MAYSDDSCEKDEDCKEAGYFCDAGQCLLGSAFSSQNLLTSENL